jgi:hypothetical protein
MNDKWIEVFKAGRQTDSAGREREWTEDDLDKISESYNGQTDHEAPVVVGHPQDNSPAFGWVEGLKREGDTLFARFKDVSPEFTNLVKQGVYKKRSISLYPDRTLRHIGFLGGMPPAVKGLANIAFKAEDESITFEFSNHKRSGTSLILQQFREFLINKFDMDTADKVASLDEIEGVDNAPGQGVSATQEAEDMDKLKKLEDQLAASATELGQFSERIKTLTEENAGLKAIIAEGEQTAVERELSAFCDTLPTRVIPAVRPAVIAYMKTLHGLEEMVFTEANGTVTKKSPLADYQESLRNLPEMVVFAEQATKARAGDPAPAIDAAEIAKQAVEYRKAEAAAGRIVTMTQAVAYITKGGK